MCVVIDKHELDILTILFQSFKVFLKNINTIYSAFEVFMMIHPQPTEYIN